MATTLQDVLSFIRNPELDLDDRQAIVDTLNRQQRDRRADAKAGLRRGMKVSWFSNRVGRQVTGHITKVNRVNCDVTEDGNMMKWRVSPQLLTAAE